MKKSDLFLAIATLSIICCCSLSLKYNQALGQTSSSSSGAATTTSGSTSTTTSSSGTATTSSTSGATATTSGSAESTTSGSTPTTTSSSGAATTTSSSGSVTTSSTVSENFTGVWQAKLDRTVTINGTTVKEGSRVINFKLCVSDNKIKGILEHPGIFKRALITTDSVVSETEVKLNLKDRAGREGTLTLKLNGEQLNGTFGNGVSFIAIKRSKLNPIKACALIGLSEGVSGEPTSTGPGESMTGPAGMSGMAPSGPGMNGPAGPEGNPGNMTGIGMNEPGPDMVGMIEPGPDMNPGMNGPVGPEGNPGNMTGVGMNEPGLAMDNPGMAGMKEPSFSMNKPGPSIDIPSAQSPKI